MICVGKGVSKDCASSDAESSSPFAYEPSGHTATQRLVDLLRDLVELLGDGEGERVHLVCEKK